MQGENNIYQLCQLCQYFRSLQCKKGVYNTNPNELGEHLQDIETNGCRAFKANNFYTLKEDSNYEKEHRTEF